VRIGIIGASGNVGSRVLAEAVARGHDVVAFTRSGAAKKGPPWRDLDIFDLEGLQAVAKSVDVIVSSYHPGSTARDPRDAIQRAISDPSVYPRAATNLLKALESRPSTRLIVVGGAASLEMAPGVTADGDDGRMRGILKSLGVPEDYVVAVKGHHEALDLFRQSNRKWTYASPSADIHAGTRTGRFRVGGDQLLVDAEGRSHISYEDFAAAIVDEIEEPRHIQRRFTVGY
jgi:putative NADH-flavin reductase